MQTLLTEPKVFNHVQNGEIVNTVYKTFDLDIFENIDGNRVPNLQHVKRLTDSIKTYGMKCNPILVNEKMQVIDGQHRLMAAKEAKTFVYYIILNGYTLSEVHTLNLNQKNWNKKDYMEGYANMGIEPYIKLKRFCEKNNDYNFSDCIALCQNSSNSSVKTLAYSYHRETIQIFEKGTWEGENFELAQEWADKIRMIKPYYSNYIRSSFVGTMITLFKNPIFDFNEFMHKLRLQPTALVDCANREQYRTLIEDIYNFRSRSKISLKY
jgi:hypothetical protein